MVMPQGRSWAESLIQQKIRPIKQAAKLDILQ